jgi:hypothetical protein
MARVSNARAGYQGSPARSCAQVQYTRIYRSLDAQLHSLPERVGARTSGVRRVARRRRGDVVSASLPAHRSAAPQNALGVQHVPRC